MDVTGRLKEVEDYLTISNIIIGAKKYILV